MEMSEYEELATEVMEAQEPETVDGSLRSRMQLRAEELERITTERFPLPGWEDLLEVELRVSGLRAATKIAQRNARIRDEGTKNLYVMCDLLLGATVGFWQLSPDETRKSIQADWVSLARNLDGCPENPTPRQAMIFLLKEHRVPWLYADWETWMRSAQTEVDEELAADLGPTG
jgi:hypothetical protein